MYFGPSGSGVPAARETVGPSASYGPTVVLPYTDKTAETFKFRLRPPHFPVAKRQVVGLGFAEVRSIRSYFGPVSIEFKMRGTADNLFATMEISGTLSGVHDPANIYGNDVAFDTAVTSEATLSTLPWTSALALGTFDDIRAEATLTQIREIQGLSDAFDIAAASNMLLSTPLPMQATSAGFDLAADADGYLFTYNFQIQNFNWAPGIAW